MRTEAKKEATERTQRMLAKVRQHHLVFKKYIRH